MSRPIRNKTAQKRRTANHQSALRIIGGLWRGQKLYFQESKGLRPTLDRVRETLFNWLMSDIHGSTCLDLFAGSGALGFEAASRGAKAIRMVELDPIVSKNLQANITRIGAENIKLETRTAEDFLSQNNQLFDIVFVDPPFSDNILQKTLQLLHPHLAENALVYVEQAHKANGFELSNDWQIVKIKQTSGLDYALIRVSDISE